MGMYDGAKLPNQMQTKLPIQNAETADQGACARSGPNSMLATDLAECAAQRGLGTHELKARAALKQASASECSLQPRQVRRRQRRAQHQAHIKPASRQLASRPLVLRRHSILLQTCASHTAITTSDAALPQHGLAHAYRRTPSSGLKCSAFSRRLSTRFSSRPHPSCTNSSFRTAGRMPRGRSVRV